MKKRQMEHLLTACDEILDSDDAGIVAAIIVWPDAAKPSGVGTMVLPELDGQKREGDCHYILTESEAEARLMLAKFNQTRPSPLIPLAQ
jgi:hypothetical protein